MAVVRRWIGHVEAYALPMSKRLAEVTAPVLESLQAFMDEEREYAFIHRDLHDKQIFVDGVAGVTLIDLDTLSAGDPAIDLVNLLAHLELRVLQGRCLRRAADRVGDVILGAYRPDCSCRHRLRAYRKASRLRLACVYSFRPRCGAVAGRLHSAIADRD